MAIVFIKPDCYDKRYEIISDLIELCEKPFIITKIIDPYQFTEESADRFYFNNHKLPDEIRYRNVKFIASGPVMVLHLFSNNDEELIKSLRDVIGSTNPEKAYSDTIRSKYGTKLPMNAIHCTGDVMEEYIEYDFFFDNDDK